MSSGATTARALTVEELAWVGSCRAGHVETVEIRAACRRVRADLVRCATSLEATIRLDEAGATCSMQQPGYRSWRSSVDLEGCRIEDLEDSLPAKRVVCGPSAARDARARVRIEGPTYLEASAHFEGGPRPVSRRDAVVRRHPLVMSGVDFFEGETELPLLASSPEGAPDDRACTYLLDLPETWRVESDDGQIVQDQRTENVYRSGECLDSVRIVRVPQYRVAGGATVYTGYTRRDGAVIGGLGELGFRRVPWLSMQVGVEWSQQTDSSLVFLPGICLTGLFPDAVFPSFDLRFGAVVGLHTDAHRVRVLASASWPVVGIGLLFDFIPSRRHANVGGLATISF
jgi:hypothetical protein